MMSDTVLVMRHGGSHLIIPMINMLTKHFVYAPKSEEALQCDISKAVVFYRNPRNQLTAHWRWKLKGQKAPEDEIDDRIASFLIKKKESENFSPITYLDAWSKYCFSSTTALFIRFEDFRISHEAIQNLKRIASYFDAKTQDVNRIYHHHYGKGTYTGNHSDWRQYWGPKTIKAYEEHGGLIIDRRMGYAE